MTPLANNGNPVLNEVLKYEIFISDKLDPHWVSDYAKAYAEYLTANKMTINQLRAFYNEFLRVNEIAAKSKEEWIIMAKLIVAKANYRANSSSAKIPGEFTKFVDKLITQVGQSPKKLSEACLVIEALVAYFAKPKPNQNNYRR